MVLPETGVTPSPSSMAAKVVGCPLAITVGLVAANFVVASSLLIVKGADVELAESNASPGNVAVRV
jgi:hypothetical protein